MRPLIGLRNILVIMGAYYLSAYAVMPLWWPVMWLTQGRVYHPGPEVLLTEGIQMIPVLISVILAGAASGYFLASSRYALWVGVVGVFMAISVWSSAHWQGRPPISGLVQQGVKAVVAGLLAAVACWMVLRWRRRAEARNEGA